MQRTRYDETWHRLREWTKGQTPSERLAAQILIYDGFKDLDPSHPLGGKDGGKDAVASKGERKFAMAVYFPRGQQTFGSIRTKFENDLEGARLLAAYGIAFVTNQEISLSEREALRALAQPLAAELYHLERITAVLDDPTMASVREQFLDIATNDLPTIQLGGKGGAAPGAGGGGGGAIGPSATGGDGGPGGEINIHGSPGVFPGAGGGGAGAVGDGAIGGEGGGGGEYVSVTFGPEEIGPDSGVHHFEIQVGKGGDGGPGEDSIINLCDEKGNVLRSIAARGGKAGAPPCVPLPSRSPTDEDFKAGLTVTGILAAEYIRCKNGLWTILDGGWDWYETNTNPFRIALPIFVEIETGTIAAGTNLDIKVVVCDPDSFQVYEMVQTVAVEDALVRRVRFCTTLNFSGSKSGLWSVRILAGSQILKDFPIEIRAPTDR